MKYDLSPEPLGATCTPGMAFLEYWLVDPVAQTITVMTPGEDGFETAAAYGRSQTLTSPTLPGLALDLDDLF